MITPQQLTDAIGFSGSGSDIWVDPLNEAADRFEINTGKRLSQWLAQVAWESNGFTALSEGLNYSALGLVKTFPTHFTEDNAQQYAHEPQAIANHVYANRHGNGPESSGDGWKFRGAGLIQLTFRDGQTECANYFGKSADEVGDWLRTKEGAALSAGWFWTTGAGNHLSQAAINYGVQPGCNLNDLADADDFHSITLAVNGGTNGIDGRLALLKRAQPVFA